MCEHGDVRGLCREFFELGYRVGRDDAFRDERLAAAATPANVVSFQEYRSAKLAPSLLEHDA